MAETTTNINQPWAPIGAGIEKAIDLGATAVGKTPPTSALGLPEQAGYDPFSQRAQDMAAGQLGLGSFTRDPTTGAVTNIGAGTGVSGYAPYLTGTGTQAGAATLMGPGAGTGLGSISTYMSPYTSAIKQSALKSFDDQRLIDQQGLQHRALKANAFGGGRHGLTESDFMQQSLIDRSKLVAGLDQGAFADARTARTGDRDAYMDLAKQIQIQGQGDVTQLGALGQAGQLYGQAGIDTSAQAAQQKWSEPMNRINWYANLLGGLGGGLGQSSPYGNFGPAQATQSPGMQAINTGLGALNTGKYLRDIWNS